MKIRHLARLVLLATIAALVFTGCGQLLGSLWGLGPAVSSSERIELFEAELNSDRSNIDEHLHPDVPSAFSSASAWSTYFPREIDSETVDYVFAEDMTCAPATEEGFAHLCSGEVDASVDTSELEGATLIVSTAKDPDQNDSSFVMKLEITNSAFNSVSEPTIVVFDGTAE